MQHQNLYKPFVLLELTLAKENKLADSWNRPLGEGCINPFRPTRSLNGLKGESCGFPIALESTGVRLKVEENQLVDVFIEIGFPIDSLKDA